MEVSERAENKQVWSGLQSEIQLKALRAENARLTEIALKYHDTADAEVERLQRAIRDAADKLAIDRKTDHSDYETLTRITQECERVRKAHDDLLTGAVSSAHVPAARYDSLLKLAREMRDALRAMQMEAEARNCGLRIADEALAQASALLGEEPKG